MKKNEDKGINFFQPKINLNLDEQEVFVRKDLLKISLKIYLVIFLIVVIYLLFNMFRINVRYAVLENKIEKMSESNVSAENLKIAIEEEKNLKDIFDSYLLNNKVSSKILEEIDKTNNNNIKINEMDYSMDNIKIICSSKSEKEAIIFTNNLRKNENFKDINYSGGSLSSSDGIFKFEINIAI